MGLVDERGGEEVVYSHSSTIPLHEVGDSHGLRVES